MKLKIDLKDAYISNDGEINDVKASYSRSGNSGSQLITIGTTNVKIQGVRRKGKSISDFKSYEFDTEKAIKIINILSGKNPEHPPRFRGWIGATIQEFTCEPRKKTFFG